MLALVFAGMMRKRRYIPVGVTTLIVLLVGASRIYLGAHWLSDVLGGYALGGLWLSVLVALMLARAKPRGRDVSVFDIIERAA
jgi:undecaprenyl-diphosphatase